jgi:excisionase family DNA binding protein
MLSNQKNNEPTMEVLLLRVREAAKCLGLSRATVYRLISRQSIPVVRIGGAVRISPQALRQYVAELEARLPVEQADEVEKPKRRDAK